MNIIDYKFKDLINSIKNLTFNNIFTNTLNNYLKINDETKLSIERFLEKFKYWGNLDFKNGNFEELHLRAASLKNNLEDIIWLYEELSDYRSKQILMAILDYWYKSDFNLLDKAFEKNYQQYFDLDLIKCNSEEIYVDIGAYNGDTIKNYIDNYKNYKKIYAYEITEENINKMQENLKKFDNIIYVNKAISDNTNIKYIDYNKTSSSANKLLDNGTTKVECTTLDIDIKEKVSFIKMDIEGGEYAAINGAKEHIKNDTPKLAIAVYHNHEDIYRIPKLIYNTNKNYNFYLRYFGNRYYPTEIVLLAIPKNS